jgi:TRAP-type mannitol/chloroaromatic compound transport system permease large subunit
MTRDVSMRDIYRGILPFLWADVVLLLLLLFPDLALFLSRLMT